MPRDNAKHPQRATTSPSGAFDLLGDWPVTTVGAALIDSTGEIVASAGSTEVRLPITSVTKVATATAVLVATEEGTIGLDDPGGPPGSTVAHLLAHASGLGPQGQVLTDPGRSRIYSNAGFEVLADLVAERSGMSFARYLSEAVCEPLGMADTTLEGSPAHGCFSTVGDIAKLAATWLRPGTVLAAETVTTASTVTFPNLSGVLPGFGSQKDNSWGLGVEIRGTKTPHWTGRHNSSATFGHFGQSGTFMWVDPEVELALVVLTDRDFGDWAKEAWPTLSDAVVAASRET